MSGLFALSCVRASSFRPYERWDGNSSRDDRNVSHIRRPATTVHSAQFPPEKAELLPPESFGIVFIRIRPTFDQCWILHACGWSARGRSEFSRRFGKERGGG